MIEALLVRIHSDRFSLFQCFLQIISLHALDPQVPELKGHVRADHLCGAHSVFAVVSPTSSRADKLVRMGFRVFRIMSDAADDDKSLPCEAAELDLGEGSLLCGGIGSLHDPGPLTTPITFIAEAHVGSRLLENHQMRLDSCWLSGLSWVGGDFHRLGGYVEYVDQFFISYRWNILNGDSALLLLVRLVRNVQHFDEVREGAGLSGGDGGHGKLF